MATSDTVVGIVGAVILTGAMVAVFYYENQAGADGPATVIGEGAEAFTFMYEQSEAFAVASGTTLDEHTGQLADQATDTFSFEIPAWTYNVSVIVSWTETDDPAAGTALGSGPDTFSVDLINNQDVAYGPVDDDGSPIDLFHFHATEADVTPPDITLAVRADDEAGARAELDASTDGVHGKGSWQAVVFLTDVANGVGGQDAGNSYTITVRYEFWEPVLQTDGSGTSPAIELSDGDSAFSMLSRVI